MGGEGISSELESAAESIQQIKRHFRGSVVAIDASILVHQYKASNIENIVVVGSSGWDGVHAQIIDWAITHPTGLPCTN
jgi:hypothetical protein